MTQRVVLYIRFKTKPGKKEEFRQHLCALVEIMKAEPAFVNAIIHEDPEYPNDMVIYETWQGTRESWLRNEVGKAYRAPYEKLLTELVEERRAVFLTPLDEWRQSVHATG